MSSERTTIIEELTKLEPMITNNSTSKRSTSINTILDPAVANWEPWENFSFEVMWDSLKDILDSKWNPPAFAADPEEHEKHTRNEETLEHQIITPHLIPRVVAGLRHGVAMGAVKGLDLNSAFGKMVGQQIPDSKPLPLFFMGRGSRTGCREMSDRYHCDYGLFCENYPRDPQSTSLKEDRNNLPGETKQSCVWNSKMPQMGRDQGSEQWKPVRQALRYADEAYPSPRPFTYIVTDKEFVAMKIIRPETESGLSRSREPRSTATPKGTYPGFDTDRRKTTDSMASFDGGNIPVTDGYTVKYKSIKYLTGVGSRQTRSSHRVMTVRLAWWWLSWKAAFGEDGYDDDDDRHDSPPPQPKKLPIRENPKR